MITPVVVWNARHGWASFEFQGARGVPSGGLRPAQFLTMVLGEIAFLSPWIFAILVAGVVSAFRRWRDDRYLLLLCLSLPPIVLFTLTPLWGGRGQPHWTMPGWFFAFPLMGAWVDQLGVSIVALRRWALASSALLAAIAGAAVVDASTGWPWTVLAAGSRSSDPLLESFDWRDLARAPVFDPPPELHHLDQMVRCGENRARLRASDPCFRAFERSARLGLPGRQRKTSSAGAGSLSRGPQTPHRSAPSPAPCSPGWDSPSFMRWAVSAAPRSSSLSSRPPA